MSLTGLKYYGRLQYYGNIIEIFVKMERQIIKQQKIDESRWNMEILTFFLMFSFNYKKETSQYLEEKKLRFRK